jgi:hypothetical protein
MIVSQLYGGASISLCLIIVQICMALIDAGVNAEALAAVITELRAIKK